VLFIEYDVTADGTIELVALVNAVEEDGQDDDGATWLAWRASHEDAGWVASASLRPTSRP